MQTSLDNIRNALLIITSIIAIVGIIVNASNELLIEIIKGKYRHNIESKSFIETAVQVIWYIVIAIDIIGISRVILIPLVETIHSFIVSQSISAQNDSFLSFYSLLKNYTKIYIFFTVFVIMFIWELVCTIKYFFRLKDEYLNKINGVNLENIGDRINKYRKRIRGGAIVSGLSIVLLTEVISNIIVLITLDELFSLGIVWANSVAMLIILINLENACGIIQKKSLYKMVLSDKEEVYCRVYLEFKDFYMVCKDKKERYIKKSEVKEILIEANEDLIEKKNKKKFNIKINGKVYTKAFIDKAEKKLNGYFKNCIKWIMEYKYFSIFIALIVIFLGPILAAQGYFRLFIKWIFGGSSNAIAYLQYIGALVGGIATLVALYITVKQTRKIQEDNKKQTDSMKEIDNLKMQIEFSKNTSKVTYECEIFLLTLNKKIEKLLRKSNLVNKTDDMEEASITEEHDKFNYEAMKNDEELMNDDFNINLEVKEINMEIDLYIQRLMIESASITDKKINDLVRDIYISMFSNEFVICNTVNEKNNNTVKELLNNLNNSLNLTINLLIYFQFNIKDYIIKNQNKINNLIKRT